MVDLLIRALIATAIAGVVFLFSEKVVQHRKASEAQHGAPEPDAHEAEE